MTENTQQKHTPIVFQGKTSEYFGIWIVNLLLSIVTLGIYSAWAKVRRKKYFYNNTLIENVGFDYHAKPISILKGRIIAVVFFAGYGMSASIHPFLPAVFLLIFFLALPWLVVRGSIFNARNTSHRGLRFDFIGTLGQAAKVFIGLPMLMLPTLGLIFPYVAHQKSQFLVNNHRFGLSQFDMQPVVKKYYKIYLILFIIPFAIIGILAAIAIPAYQSYVNKAKAAQHSELAIPAGVAAFATVSQTPKMILAANEAPAEAPTVERVYTDEKPPAEAPAEMAEPALPIEQMVEDTVQNAEEMSAEAQMESEVANEAAVEKTLDEMMKEKQEADKEKMLEMIKNPSMLLAMIAGFLVYILIIFAFAGYIQARISNLIWNNTTLDKLSFSSSLRARDFIWLYFSNIVAIMLTFGLATPWAQIRMAKYRASKLQIVGDVDFDQFVGDKKAEVKATGEEIAEMFDVDLSFG
jgi:uncharacterized membrane protein YjgN (DUF898 family)